MKALAGGGTFATLPALIALGLPATIANATSNVALLPGAAASAWTHRDELHPVAGIAVRLLAAITFVAGLAGSALLVLTPTETFDVIIPWLLLFAFAVMMFGKRAADWLHARVTIGRPASAGHPVAARRLRRLFRRRRWSHHDRALRPARQYPAARAVRDPHDDAGGREPRGGAGVRGLRDGVVVCLPMLAGSILGGWLGARLGKTLSPWAVYAWTLLVTGATTLAFFVRAYA